MAGFIATVDNPYGVFDEAAVELSKFGTVAFDHFIAVVEEKGSEKERRMAA